MGYYFFSLWQFQLLWLTSEDSNINSFWMEVSVPAYLTVFCNDFALLSWEHLVNGNGSVCLFFLESLRYVSTWVISIDQPIWISKSVVFVSLLVKFIDQVISNLVTLVFMSYYYWRGMWFQKTRNYVFIALQLILYQWA